MEGIDKLEKPKNCTVRFELKENQFTVTKELSNIGISNKSNIVTKGKSFSAKLTPYKGYVLTEVTVKMNGRDVKAPFNNKSCNIKISKVMVILPFSLNLKNHKLLVLKSLSLRKEVANLSTLKLKQKQNLLILQATKRLQL